MIRIFTIIICCCFGYNLAAQTFVMDGSPITTCEGIFTDSGGNADYSANENLSTTICPDGSTGTHIRITFFTPDLGNGETLCFFDGEDNTAPQIACITDFDLGSTFAIQASALNLDGCVTVVFTSDASGQASGWSSSIECIPACQLIEAVLVSSTPAAEPAVDGWIDVCPGESITFFGAGNYPENGIVYEHSDYTADFEWNFGDGDIAYGPIVSHTYNEPGGYVVQLSITDQLNCNNSNLISQRVRVSTRPDFELAGDIPSEICSSDTIQLSALVNDINDSNEVSVNPTQGSFQVEGIRSDSLPLPDGVGISYETCILFTDFTPGAILTDINDMLGVCVNMEHSYMHDLQIELICPDGTEVVLQQQVSQGQVFLGVPNDPDGNGPTSIQTNWGLIQPGEGYEYCWTPSALLNWTEYYQANSPATLPAGDYASFGDLEDFIGCPLNGEWCLRVTDLWGIDNGFIFSWSINFSETLYPDIETFTPSLLQYEWLDNPSIFYPDDLVNEDSIAAAPQNAGTANYIFRVTDDFGCAYDTSVNVNILPFTDPSCFSCQEQLNITQDTSVCEGDAITLDAIQTIPFTQQLTYETFPNYLIGYANHPPNNPHNAVTSVASVFPATITDAENEICSVCVDFDTDFAGDITISLRSPSGEVIELTSDNGGSGDNFTHTCFVPGASTPIQSGSAPFTGNFEAEGDWADLNGSPTNGDWALMISDAFGTSKFGELKAWSICFNSGTEYSYEWEPSAALSCTDCPNPTVTTDVTTTFNVEITDNYNCTSTGDFTVNVVDVLPGPELTSCIPTNDDELTITWSEIPNAADYSISLDEGVTWITPTGSNSHVIDGLTGGTSLELWVRPNQGAGPSSCEAEIGVLDCLLPLSVCDGSMEINIISTVEPACHDSADGLVNLITQGATPPITYSLNGGPFVPGTTINNIPPGPHSVVGLDAEGCVDSVSFVLSNPPEIVVDYDITDVSCFGGMDGSITANVSGGTGSLSCIWNTIPSTFNCTVGGLSAGVLVEGTVQDSEGCQVILSTLIAEVNEPPLLELTVTPEDPNCFGGTGVATASGMGGVGGYMYEWSDGTTGDVVTGLMPGLYDVTVTDMNNCTAFQLFEIFDTDELVVSATGTDSTCGGTGDGTATANVVGGTDPIMYAWDDNNNQDTQTAINLPAGPVTVTVTDGQGCTGTATVTILDGISVVMTASSTPTLCVDSTDGTATADVTDGVPPYNYLWDDGQMTQTATGLAPGPYGVTVTDYEGCTGVANTTVLSAEPIVTSISATVSSCVNTADGTATVMASGGTESFNYEWDDDQSSDTPTATGLLPGMYSVTVTDGNNCTAVETVEVPMPDAVSIIDIVPVHLDCFGDTDGQATVSVTGGTEPYFYLWDDINMAVAPTVTGLPGGIYNVTVSDSNGCSFEGTVEIDEPDELTISATGIDALCFGEASGQAQSTPIGGTPPYTYLWDDGTGQTTMDATDLEAGGYNVVVTDANLCTATANVVIGEPATAIALSVNQESVGCFGENNGSALAVAMGGSMPYTYEWSDGQINDLAIGLDGGEYFVTATDVNGCFMLDTVVIDQLDSIEIQIAKVEPNCFGYADGQVAVTGVLGGAGDGTIEGYTYLWNTTPAISTPLINNVEGDQTYVVTVTDPLGCFNIVEITLDQPPAIDLQSDVLDASCFGSSDGEVTINPIGDATDFTYLWAANANDQTTQTATGLSAGTYQVTVTEAVTMTDSVVCTASTDVTVNQPDPINTDFTSVDNVCNNLFDGELTVTISGGTPIYDIEWSTGDSTNTATDLYAGYHSLTITDANGCMHVDSSNVGQPDPLFADVSQDSITCFGDRDGTIYIEAGGGTPPYLYSLDAVEYNGSSTKIGLEAGEYQIYMTDANGCVYERSYEVLGPPEFTVDAGMDVTIEVGDSILLPVNYENSQGLADLYWQPPYPGTLSCDTCSVTCDTCSNAWSYTQNTITYELYGIDAYGCEAFDDIEVRVVKPRDVYVATGFSPNGDNINDILSVQGRPGTNIRSFRVYDRWGEMIYELRNFEINTDEVILTGWDGTFGSTAMPSGVYVWVTEVEYIDGATEVLKGQVTLLR